MLNKKKIAFIGAGSMAEAMIAGITKAGIIPNHQVYVSNRKNEARLNELALAYGVNGVKQDRLPFEQIDIFILAMKPKDAEVAIDFLKSHIHSNQCVISVLAGISTSFFENHLHIDQQVIRIMPNTSSMIGESATALSSGKYTTKQNIQFAIQLFKCIGEVYEIEEKDMDIFTGMAGSGPAYFYYLMEHMEKAVRTSGLNEDMTRRIISQTIIGAAKMVQRQEETPSELRENVTSPNGTTAAGLAALEQHGGGKAITQAVKEAASRSKEISSELETFPQGKTKLQAI
ncbi:pyrroline-5-carboxylate reductase [Cytobacillus spongiae]|uniref:pyrroline-5-carboxylate reductase n=1 Tax=Cytobacillus spongiae TaxID=2901381 RepID=UPI001F3464EE|nr:pyrroline-5-carboxylate reductase [Cytobacillus spongiae]UII54453.1 pyrroline-5-carboxylate reductase [Cytobacillus spongiae]